jgi:plasmid stability protein
MARSLIVRNIPDELYDRLREQADLEGRSLSAQAVAILKRALGGRLVDRERVWREAQERMRSVGPWGSGAELIREDRDSR